MLRSYPHDEVGIPKHGGVDAELYRLIGGHDFSDTN